MNHLIKWKKDEELIIEIKISSCVSNSFGYIIWIGKNQFLYLKKNSTIHYNHSIEILYVNALSMLNHQPILFYDIYFLSCIFILILFLVCIKISYFLVLQKYLRNLTHTTYLKKFMFNGIQVNLSSYEASMQKNEVIVNRALTSKVSGFEQEVTLCHKR